MRARELNEASCITHGQKASALVRSLFVAHITLLSNNNKIWGGKRRVPYSLIKLIILCLPCSGVAWIKILFTIAIERQHWKDITTPLSYNGYLLYAWFSLCRQQHKRSWDLAEIGRRSKQLQLLAGKKTCRSTERQNQPSILKADQSWSLHRSNEYPDWQKSIQHGIQKNCSLSSRV